MLILKNKNKIIEVKQYFSIEVINKNLKNISLEELNFYLQGIQDLGFIKDKIGITIIYFIEIILLDFVFHIHVF